MNKNLSHISKDNQPKMVGVGHKEVSYRTARATSKVSLPNALIETLEDGDLPSPKGPVFQTAIIAGTMACKKTSELIPFCHPLSIEDCKITISVNGNNEAVIECFVAVHHKTGVEMEAMTGASIAALTIYDMCKAISHDMVIMETRLIEKRGGKSDYNAESG